MQEGDIIAYTPNRATEYLVVPLPETSNDCINSSDGFDRVATATDLDGIAGPDFIMGDLATGVISVFDQDRNQIVFKGRIHPAQPRSQWRFRRRRQHGPIDHQRSLNDPNVLGDQSQYTYLLFNDGNGLFGTSTSTTNRGANVLLAGNGFRELDAAFVGDVMMAMTTSLWSTSAAPSMKKTALWLAKAQNW